jgi:HEAT repeat protein
MSRSLKHPAALLVLAAALATPALAGARYATSESGSEQRSTSYREAQRALDRENWDQASRLFDKIASGATDEADAALYWKAYADWKQLKKKESLEELRHLVSAYPKSAWVDDAKALEVEIRGGKSEGAGRSAGGRARGGPEGTDDEELKLYALDGLMQVEPEKAVPVLEKLLAGSASQRVKERALFVLSQSDSPRAREILVRTAKSGQPISLRREAVKTLGIAGEPEDLAALATIARDPTAPTEVREAVVDAYLIADRPDALVGIATSDPDPRIREKAIDALGAIDALSALRQLWTTEKDPALREKLVQAFGVAGDVDTLAKIARETKDPELRRKAINGLGIAEGPAARRTLRQLYGEYTSTEDKRQVLQALMMQDDAKTLVELFRAEKDPTLKKAILQQISLMDDPEAMKVILDVLGE